MKLKTYSMRIKKNIAVLLHIIFLTLAIGGISFMYLNSQIGSGISWLLDRRYEDTERFQEQLQGDLELLFRYVTYRDVFETDGSLDLSKEMFSVTKRDGPETIYTLEEVIRYAQSQGFYLNDDFEVVNDLFIYNNASTAKDYRVNWRSYDTNRTIEEPGDAYASLLDLAREVMDCLSDYYSVYYRFIANPSNLTFQIVYENQDGDQMMYSNAEDLSLAQIRALGRFCYLSSDSVFIETNLREIPQNLTTNMERGNFYDAPNYYLAVAVDTSYPAEDAYQTAQLDYQVLRGRFLEGLAGLAIGIIGCLTTLYYLILVSGYQTEERINPYLHGFDMITTESCVALTVIFTLFALFLGEKIGYRLVHLLVLEDAWPYAERMLRAVIIYTCCVIGAFSLLRRYKSRVLWSNSIIHHFQTDFSLYFSGRTFSHRLICAYASFVAAHIAAAGVVAAALRYLGRNHALVVVGIIVLGLLTLDYQIFRKMYYKAIQEDRIADTVARLADGDTSYQMSMDGLTGKELVIAERLNGIGTGLERALQEQVKSERLKADLITNVSHDIKTPLTSIINYVDLIKREKIPNEKVQEYLNILDQKSQRLKNLTEDLVEASKASSGTLPLEMTQIDFVEMIWQTNGEFEEKFSLRHLELVSNLPDHALVIEADGRRLWRVLENLYSNAFKYAMEHSRVYVDVEEKDKTVLFTIKNVSETPLNIQGDELTERFVRGDVSRSTEGSGLGLSIATSLTKLQGGTFEILIDGDLFKVQLGFILANQP